MYKPPIITPKKEVNQKPEVQPEMEAAPIVVDIKPPKEFSFDAADMTSMQEKHGKIL